MHNLKIKNVRCYTNKEIEFRRGINVLIGDNSVGKTSLLRACSLVMNAFFAGYSEKYTRWESAGNKDFHFWYNANGLRQIAPKMEIEFDVYDSDLPPIINADGNEVSLKADATFKIEKKSKKNSNPLKTGIKELVSYGKELKDNSHILTGEGLIQKNSLPVYAVFSTDDIHSQTRKFDKTGFRDEAQIPSFGYFKCVDTRALFGLWIKRMLVLQETESFTELNNVVSALLDTFGKDGCGILSDVKLFVNKKTVAFVQTDGRVIDFDYLSDGYCRLFNIVIDIAFRCALLNKGIHGERAYKHTHGTVIIDEIDEHLHPELQVRILKALHNTFPKIQFIVSTHAPLVMSSVETNEDNVVFKLEYKNGTYTHTELNTYGLDANLLLKEGMEAVVRDTKASKLFEKLDSFIKLKDIANAKTVLAELEELTDPQQPELVRVRAIINRIELIGR